MFRIAFVLILPSLIVAESQCALECPKGQWCCTIDNQQSCCEEGQPPVQSNLLAAPLNTSASIDQHGSTVQPGPSASIDQQGPNAVSSCSTIPPCNGTCCTYYSCCYAYRFATCCPNNYCCPMLTNCCGYNICCSRLNECCGAGCCPYNTKCCYGSFCCKKNQRCGAPGSHVCYGAAANLSPTSLVTLLATWMIVYAVKKL